jgi:ubiquinone/menaquinone biosynthesis C-methylase UbiE
MQFDENIEDRVVLDLGCGEGALLQKLQGHPSCAIGLDIDLKSLRKALQSQESTEASCIRNSTHYIQGDGNKLPFKNDSIDHIISIVALLHLDQRKALSEVKRILRPGGSLTFTYTGPWYLIIRIIAPIDQSKTSSRSRSIIGLLYILFNGILYNYLGIAPLLRRFTAGMWFIYLSDKRLTSDIEKAGLVVVKRETITMWGHFPIRFQWTVRKPEQS